jgi:hypothetical protein
MSAGDKSARIQTQPAQRVGLRTYFLSKHAEKWLRDDRNKHFNGLIRQPEFVCLMTSHVSYQWRKFLAEFIVRKHVGAAFWRASKQLSTVPYVSSIIFDIISIMYGYFETAENPEFNIPTKILAFMIRCRRISQAFSQAVPTIDEDTLTEDDNKLVSQLIDVVVDIYKRYGVVWENFQEMESSVAAGDTSASTKPHLIVADQELKLLQERHAWAAEPQGDSPQVDFMTNTDIGKWLAHSTNAELFPNPRPEAPHYIGVALFAQPGNDIELQRTIYTAFDAAAYEVYERRLIIVELLQGPENLALNPEEVSIATGYSDRLEDHFVLNEGELKDTVAASNRLEDDDDLSGK